MYNGRILTELPPGIDLRKVDVVLVTGTTPNVCGHLLIHVSNGHYFHFDGPSPTDFPRYLTEFQYRSYLSQSKKRELARRSLLLPCPERARAKLITLMTNKWATWLIAHNCATFVGEVVRAGGNFWAVPQHCPTLDMNIELFFDRLLPYRKLEVTQCR